MTEHAVDIESTSEVGAGVALADAPLAQYDFAVAVIPAAHGQQDMALTAIYVEIGIVTGRDLPLLVIAELPDSPSPALVGATTIITQLGNQEALRLQLGLFLRLVRAVPRVRGSGRPPVRPGVPVPAEYVTRLQTARASTAEFSGLAFERFVGDLLREAGAQAEERPPGEPDGGVDIAAFIPGEEQRLGSIMIQVKSGTLTGRVLRETQQRLSTQVRHTGAGLGLLVYDRATPDARKVPPAPLVSILGIDELLAELETRPLSAVLTQARNRAVHGM